MFCNQKSVISILYETKKKRKDDKIIQRSRKGSGVHLREIFVFLPCK